MHICIDSCVFIQGLRFNDSASGQLLRFLKPGINISIPRLLVQEIARNLVTIEQVRSFYRLFHQIAFATIIDVREPHELVVLYVERGLREEGDAFIGGFTEWVRAWYLISLNRHFLSELSPNTFAVITPATFINRVAE